MFRPALILLLSITLYIVDAREIPRFGDRKVSPLPKIRADPAKYRLPGGTTPNDYVVVLKVDPNQQEYFGGNVNINVTAKRSENRIVLHSNVKNITGVSVRKEDNSDIYDSFSLSDDDTHFMTIGLKENLVIGQNYYVYIEYFGSYGLYLQGLYLSSYLDNNGTRRYLATTDFEPTLAREAFPCYDEPGLKAIFQINIYAPAGYNPLSNADVTDNTDLPPTENGLILTAFEPTVKMSSYLLAFVISDFKFKSNLDDDQQHLYHKKYRVFARPNGIQFGDYAVEYGQKSMVVLESYTTIEYALSKLDNIAIPDYAFGAMENWGLITYREPYLLYEPGVTTTKLQESIRTIMSHENAHMWFGNYVSPAWWDYTWLSEGFATYFENFATDQVAPEWRMMEIFLSDTYYRAMSYDSQPSTNAMTSSVASPDEIANNFNTIAYEKAGSVIRMMNHILGSSNFRKGLQNYLKSSPLDNAEPIMLFDALQGAIEGTTIFPSGVKVSDVFGAWSTTPGFPIVYAEKNDGNTSVTLRQERYYQDKSIPNDGEKWWIPITWVTSDEGDFENTTVQDWLHPETNEIIVEMNLRDNAWYILNKQTTGFYRVMYDDNNWKLIGKVLNSANYTKIHLLNRVQLLEDSLEFARTLRLSYNVTLDILDYMREEVDYVPWLSAYPGITFLNTMMPAAENYILYREFVRRLVDKAYIEVGFEAVENETPDIKRNRANLMDIACTSGINYCRERAAILLSRWIADTSTVIDPDLKSQVFCGGIRSASQSTWQSLWNKYDNTSESDKLLILRSLACSVNDDILKSYLSMALSTSVNIPDSQRTTIIESVITSGPRGVANGVDLVTKNFTDIKSIIPSSTVRIINTLRSRVVTESDADEFIEFADTYSGFTASEKSAVDAAVVVIKENREWLADVLYDIDSWLAANIH